MAINDNFVFSDPALQAQVVNAAQVRAAVEAARAQQFGQTLAAMRQERQAAADREERRAERDRVIREGEMRTAENKRQFDESLKFNREALTSQEKTALARQKEADEREAYNNLLNFIDKAEDIPTVSEWEARIKDLSGTRQQTLRERRNMRFTSALRDADLVGGEVGRLNAMIGKPDGKGGVHTADSLLSRSRYKNFMGIDPVGGGIQSLLRRPREDAPPEGPTFHVPAGRPPPDTYTAPTVQSQRQPGFFERYGRGLLKYNIHPVAQLVNRLFVPPVNAPPGPAPGVEPIQDVLARRGSPAVGGPGFLVSPFSAMRGGGLGGGFYVPDAAQVQPPSGGPIIDADTGEVVEPSLVLDPSQSRYDMPPMFIGPRY